MLNNSAEATETAVGFTRRLIAVDISNDFAWQLLTQRLTGLAESPSLFPRLRCFVDLIQSEVQQFLAGNQPTADTDMGELQSRELRLQTKLSVIRMAEQRALRQPKMASEIYNRTSDFARDNSVNTDIGSACLAFQLAISTVSLQR